MGLTRKAYGATSRDSPLRLSPTLPPEAARRPHRLYQGPSGQFSAVDRRLTYVATIGLKRPPEGFPADDLAPPWDGPDRPIGRNRMGGRDFAI